MKEGSASRAGSSSSSSVRHLRSVHQTLGADGTASLPGKGRSGQSGQRLGLCARDKNDCESIAAETYKNYIDLTGQRSISRERSDRRKGGVQHLQRQLREPPENCQSGPLRTPLYTTEQEHGVTKRHEVPLADPHERSGKGTAAPERPEGAGPWRLVGEAET